MMKQLLSFMLPVLLSSTALAQAQNSNNQQAPQPPGHIHLEGSITSGENTVPYIVNLIVDPSGNLSGYSITVWDAGNLKADLTGSRDKDGNLTLKEIPYAPSNNYTVYCFFQGSLKRTLRDHVITYEGDFISVNASGEAGSCDGGYMRLTAKGSAKNDPAAVEHLPGEGNGWPIVNPDTNETDWSAPETPVKH